MDYDFIYGIVTVILSIIGIIDFVGSSDGLLHGKLPYSFGVVSGVCLILLIIWTLIWEYFVW